MFLFMTFYFQDVEHYSPSRRSLVHAFSIGIILAAADQSVAPKSGRDHSRRSAT